MSLGYNLFLGVKTNSEPHSAALNGIDNGKLRVAGLLQTDEIAAVEDRSSQGSALGVNEGKKSHDASPLHGIGEITLLLGGEASQTAGQDFAALGDELLQQIDIFVVDRFTGLIGERRFEKELGMTERGENAERGDHAAGSLDLFVDRRLVAMRAELLSSIRSVVLRRFFWLV